MMPFRVKNTASDSLVKQYLKRAVTEEHARITPEQATPLLVNKLATLSHCLEKLFLSPALSPTELSIVAGDQAFFKTLCFLAMTGAVTWARLKKKAEIARFPGDDAFLFNHVWGKTLRDGGANLFGLCRHPNILICPVRVILKDWHIKGSYFAPGK